jgi:hypothetical protein
MSTIDTSAIAATERVISSPAPSAPILPQLPRRHVCPACGYDLIATITQPQRTCPECGGEFALVDLIEPLRPLQKLRRSAALLAALCLALIAVGDLFFYHQPVGCTLGLFAAVMLAAVSLREHRYLRGWPGRATLIAMIGLLLALIEHPGPLRVTMALLALTSIALLNRFEWTTSVTAWASRWSEMLLRIFAQLPIDLRNINRWTRAHGGPTAKTLRIIAKWTIPVLLSAVFVGLFAVANPIIEKWLHSAGDSIGRVFNDFFTHVTIDRVGIWLLLGLSAWALLRGRARWKSSRNGVPESQSQTQMAKVALPKFDLPAQLVRCLILFNIIFAVQMAIDLAMVLSNGAMLPEGMTYSTYARRGAYPLVATALLAAAFVLITFPSGRDSEAAAQNSHTMRWARRLVFLWIAQNVILTLSAGFRLEMYVGAFSLTRLRVAAAIWMLLVAIGLITVIWRIARHRTNTWLVRVNTVVLLLVLYFCCFVNFDSIIAWYDVKRCKEVGGPGPHLDRRYLRSLGPEAIEPFAWLAQRMDDQALAASLRSDIDDLRADLDADLINWRGWTIRRARIARALADQ